MGKIDFNDEKSFTEIKKELIKKFNEIKGNQEKINILEDSIEKSNQIIGFIIPLIKQILKKKKVVIALLILLESLIYGLTAQIIYLVQLIISLFN